MDKNTPIEDKDNAVLSDFATELKALLDKHNVSIEVESKIIAVDLSKRGTPSPVSLDAGPTA